MESVEPLDLTNLPAKLVTALGYVSARSGQIEHLLVVTLKRTTDDSWEDVFAHAEGKRGDERRREAKQYFKAWAIKESRHNEVPYRTQEFNNVIDRIGQIASRRNVAVHSAWGVSKSGDVYATNKGKVLRNSAGNPFGIKDVEAIANELHECLYIMNAATDPSLVWPTPTRNEGLELLRPTTFVVCSSAAVPRSD